MVMTVTEPILEISKLNKSFGPVHVLHDVDLNIYPGEVTALVGDNGAGKSTLVKCIAGINGIDSGEVRFEGKPVHLTDPRIAAALGIEFVYQDLALADNLDITQNMFLGREIRRFGFIADGEMERQARETLKSLSVKTVSSVRQAVANLSGGQRQTVAIAKAVLWNSKVVFLDEPTAALDPQARRNLWDLLRSLNHSGRSVVLTTHYMDEAEALCDRVAIMDRGRVLRLDSPAQLVRGLDAPVRIFVSPALLSAERARQVPGVEEVLDDGSAVVLSTRHPSQVLTRLAELEALEGLQVKAATLEDVFLDLTGRAYRA